MGSTPFVEHDAFGREDTFAPIFISRSAA